MIKIFFVNMMAVNNFKCTLLKCFNFFVETPFCGFGLKKCIIICFRFFSLLFGNYIFTPLKLGGLKEAV